MMKEMNAASAPTGGVAHDINNELATIIGTVDVLLAHVDVQSDIGDGLRDILAAALKMQVLVRQISSCKAA